MIVTLPTNLELIDWANQVILDLDPYGAFGRLSDESKWQDWAVQFLNNTTIGRNPPIPYAFDDWREWADRFCQSLS
jgi:hypothetical protein